MDERNRPVDDHRAGRSTIIEFYFVPAHEIAGEIAPNIARHVQEAEGNEGLPNMDWDSYLAASHSGMCWAVAARDDGKLIGYGIFTISNNQRFKHILEATSDGIFLEKEYRGKVPLLKKAAEILKQNGVQEINYVIRTDGKFSKVLKREGYSQNYQIWSLKT